MLELFSLSGRYVHLEPMGMDHVGELMAAAAGDRSTFAFTHVPSTPKTMAVYVTRPIEGRGLGQHYPFVTRDIQTGRVVGATRFYDMAPWDWSTGPAKANQRHGRPDAVSIGATWLASSAQRTPINTEAKLLMLTHAFETWGVWAVRFETDERNTRSRQAIERLGCKLDGILRAERPAADGTVRNTATFSMLADEWPVQRHRLVDHPAKG
jgi:RimJ/RimL family protein N-acetyltransferase